MENTTAKIELDEKFYDRLDAFLKDGVRTLNLYRNYSVPKWVIEDNRISIEDAARLLSQASGRVVTVREDIYREIRQKDSFDIPRGEETSVYWIAEYPVRPMRKRGPRH